MKFFIDTANVEEIRKANDMGVIAGVTTNPSLIAKEGRDYAETLAEIATIATGGYRIRPYDREATGLTLSVHNTHWVRACA